MSRLVSSAAEFGLLGLVLNFMYAFLFILFTTRLRLFLSFYCCILYFVISLSYLVFRIWYLLNFSSSLSTFHLAGLKQMSFTCTFLDFRTLSTHCVGLLFLRSLQL